MTSSMTPMDMEPNPEQPLEVQDVDLEDHLHSTSSEKQDHGLKHNFRGMTLLVIGILMVMATTIVVGAVCGTGHCGVSDETVLEEGASAASGSHHHGHWHGDQYHNHANGDTPHTHTHDHEDHGMHDYKDDDNDNDPTHHHSSCMECATTGNCDKAFEGTSPGQYCGNYLSSAENSLVQSEHPCCCPVDAICKLEEFSCYCGMKNGDSDGDEGEDNENSTNNNNDNDNSNNNSPTPTTHPTDNHSGPTNTPDAAEVSVTNPDFAVQSFGLNYYDNTDSLESKSYSWLTTAYGNDLFQMETWRAQQLFALVNFYYGLQGETWQDNSKARWLNASIPECSWGVEGVKGMDPIACDDQGHVTALQMYRLGTAPENQHYNASHPLVHMLKGNITSELLFLASTLKTLQINHSHWQGLLDDVLPYPSLQQLTALSFMENQLKGTLSPNIGLLTNMELLSFSANQLSGSLPTELRFLSNSLQELHLRSNAFTGPLPSELGQLTLLQDLTLHHNQFDGTLPTELGLLTQLTGLFVYSNPNLRGTIPSELGLLTGLKGLMLTDTSLTGTIPQSLCQLQQSHGMGSIVVDPTQVTCPAECNCL